MGRSFAAATPAVLNKEDFARSNTFLHKPSDRLYQMIRRGDRLFQRRSQKGSNGAETNVVEREIHYVMGSGHHARSYISRDTVGRLVELPIAWYPSKGGYWAMSPAYDRPDHSDFRRRISFQCMFCHNGYPAYPAGVQPNESDPTFPEKLPEGIDCQRCHGPGGSHVAAAQQPSADKSKLHSSILNPARLPVDRQMEVCMQCHLESTSFPLPAMLHRFDRGPFSYDPAEPLEKFVLHFDHARGLGREGKFEIVSAAYRLRQSACFLRSNGKLQCTTCHNPHDQRELKPSCRNCHASLAKSHPAGNDCVSCHMPKRRTEDVVHAVMTDHLIQRHRPAGDLLAMRAERHEVEGVSYQGEVTLLYPQSLPAPAERDLYLATAQVIQKSNIKTGLPQLEAAIVKHKPVHAAFYYHAGQAHHDEGRRSRAIQFYEQAIERDSRYAPALIALSAARIEEGQAERAVEALVRVRSMHPNDPVVLHELGRAQIAAGRAANGIATLRQAVQQRSDVPQIHNTLGGALFENGNPRDAERSFREAIRHQPDYAEAHTNLGNALAALGDLPQAEYHYRTAVRIDPKFPAARYGYGSALAANRRFEQAREQLQEAVRLKPDFPEALERLGNLHALARDWTSAADRYRAALRLNPGFHRAHLGLGTALLLLNDLAGARIHLQQAAASADPDVRQEATELLREMGSRKLLQ